MSENRDSGNYYYGGTATTPTVTGGTITVVGDYTYWQWTFTATGTYTTNTAQDVDYLGCCWWWGCSGERHLVVAAVEEEELVALEIDTNFPVTAAAHTTNGWWWSRAGGSGGNAGNQMELILHLVLMLQPEVAVAVPEVVVGQTTMVELVVQEVVTRVEVVHGGGAGNAGGYTPVEGYAGWRLSSSGSG